MEEALIALLLNAPAVTVLVADRVRPVMRSQTDNPPCVVLTTISNLPEYHTGGQSDLASARVQVDCYGKTASEALSLARVVKRAMPKRPFNQGAVEFGGIFQLGERQSFEGEVPSSRLHRVSIDFRVWHSEP